MVKIKFDIELSGKKYLTLSNRQLSMHLLHIDNKINNNIQYRLGWSIDRITLVGTVKQTKNIDGTIRDLGSIMQDILDSGMDGVEKLPKGWLLRDRYREQIAYIEYLNNDNTRGRIDFNPNKLSELIQSTLKERNKKGFGVVDGIKTWWRFEAQLRGKTTKEWFESVNELLSYFTSPNFIPLDIVGMEKIALVALLEHPELIKEMGSAHTVAKYKKLIKRVVENDELTTAMIEQFKDDVMELQKNLDSWLGYIDVTDSYTEEE